MRRFFLYGALCLGLATVFGTELLSAPKALHRSALVLYWAVVLLGAGVLLWRTGLGKRAAVLFALRARAFLKFLAASPRRIVLFIALGIFVCAVGIVALYAPPNTFDSMTYHMARVAHWQQNASVEMYPTAIARQYEYPPFAEYAILHLQILVGDDRFANLVQFGAYLGCIVVASLIAQTMGLAGDGQLLAAGVAASIPMAVNEATGTQTDLVAAFWLGSAVYWILAARAFSLRRSALLVGASLALAAFVKFPGALFAAPLGLWYVFRVWQWSASRRAVVTVALIFAVLFLVLHGPFLTRRAALTAQSFAARGATALGNELPLRYVNHRFDGAAIFSNTLRNLTLHLGLPNAEWNAALTTAVRWAHRVSGISENDNATTYPARSWQRVKFYMHEDETGNFLHLLLACGAFVWALAGRKDASTRWREYAALLLAITFVFIFVLKWEMWHSRYHTVLFLLAAPLIAAWLLHVARVRLAYAAAFGLLLAALPWLFWSQPRPLLGDTSVLRVPRAKQYFANMPALAEPYENTVARIEAQNCRAVGLWWGGNDWEYPLFALLRARNFDSRLEQLHVSNASQVLLASRATFRPCLIVAFNWNESEVLWQQTRYIERAEWKPLTLFEPQP